MGKKFFLVGLVVMLLLSGCGGKKDSTAGTNAEGSNDAAVNEPASSGSKNSSSESAHLSDALNKVLGSSDEPGVFDSYHIELNLDIPELSDDNTAVVNSKTLISADVQGKDVHIIQTDPGASESKEGFIIGDKEYKMIDGQPQEMMGQIAMGWAMWPLQVIMPYAYSAYFAQKTGTDSVDGRPADVYSFDSANASQASDSMMDSFGFGDMATGQGTVWIDQETGAMLKLDLTYTDTITDYDQNEIGPGTGHITLEISKVGQVTVTSPVQ